MAEIEEGQSGDQGKAREWLSRAVRAPRDPAWTADGLVSDEWEPTSPVTGRLDAFEWKVPMTVTHRALDALPIAQSPIEAPLPLAPASNPT
jgi:HemY protein